MREMRSISGEVTLLYRHVDRYGGDVVLLTLDTDELLALNTFEVRGELASRLSPGVLDEGMRVRIDCRSETVEMVNIENGETHDREWPVVVDVVILGRAAAGG
ncbi:MAG: hypothetical protein AB1416_02630 [Actinomycetota bacterium]